MNKRIKSTLISGVKCLTYMLIGTVITILLVPAKEQTIYLPQAYYYAAEQVETAEVTEPVEPIEEEVAFTLEDLGEFKLTAYCTCPKCCGEWADGFTYTGAKATPGRTVAVDPDVIPLGSTVYINDFAYVAEDIGGAIKGNRIDVLFPSHREALEFGVQYANVSIIK